MKKPRPINYWTVKRIRDEAKKHRHKIDFKKAAPSAYKRAMNLCILTQVTSHMVPKKNEPYWTLARVRKEALKYRYSSDFKKYSSGAYHAAAKKGWLPEVCLHFRKKPLTSKWDLKSILKIAQKFETRTDFARNGKGAYRAAQRLNVLSKVCGHMKTFAMPAGYWTKDRILKEAKKYKSRKEFIQKAPGAYANAKKLNILEQAYSHMKRLGSKYKRAIYAFEFPDNSVYVGLTFNFDRRFKEHMSHNKLIKKKSKLLKPKFVKHDQWYAREIAALKEAELIQHYLSQGWILLNSRPAGGLGKDKFWTKSLVRNEAKKYGSKSDFAKFSPKAYGAASRLNILKEVTRDMSSKQKPSGYWTKSKIIKEARKFTKRSDFQKGSSSAHQAAKRLGILDDVCMHMIRKSVPNGYWSLQRLKQISQMYKSRTEFVKNEPKAAKAAWRLGVIDEITSHMSRDRVAPGYWTKERLREEAKKYRCRVDFFKNSGPAYSHACKIDCIDEICSHMEKKETSFGNKIVVKDNTFNSLTQACRHYGLNSGTVKSRLKYGWSIDEAFGFIKRERPTPGKNIVYKGKRYRSIPHFAKSFGVPPRLVESRLYKGWSYGEAIGHKVKKKKGRRN